MVEQQSTSSLLLLASKKMNRNRIKANNENKDDNTNKLFDGLAEWFY